MICAGTLSGIAVAYKRAEALSCFDCKVRPQVIVCSGHGKSAANSCARLCCTPILCSSGEAVSHKGLYAACREGGNVQDYLAESLFHGFAELLGGECHRLAQAHVRPRWCICPPLSSVCCRPGHRLCCGHAGGCTKRTPSWRSSSAPAYMAMGTRTAACLRLVLSSSGQCLCAALAVLCSVGQDTGKDTTAPVGAEQDPVGRPLLLTAVWAIAAAPSCCGSVRPPQQSRPICSCGLLLALCPSSDFCSCAFQLSTGRHYSCSFLPLQDKRRGP